MLSAFALADQCEMARPTGFERADARNIRIPIENAREALTGEERMRHGISVASADLPSI
jgi:hypothetical protein